MHGPLLYNQPMELIYIDSLFFLNLITDYLLCLASGRICGLRLRRWRYFAAALFGAVYSVAVFLPGLYYLASPLMKLASGLCMGLIAFGAERRPLLCSLSFLAVSAAFGGALWAVSLACGGDMSTGAVMSVKTLLLSFALCYAALSLIFRCKGRLVQKRRVEVEAFFLARKCCFIALVDTGNCLTDPASGARVMIACPHALEPIFLENTALFENAGAVELVELSTKLPELSGRIRLIPYSAVGSSGLLAAFRPDKLLVSGQEETDILIAISKNAAGDGFEAII